MVGCSEAWFSRKASWLWKLRQHCRSTKQRLTSTVKATLKCWVLDSLMSCVLGAPLLFLASFSLHVCHDLSKLFKVLNKMTSCFLIKCHLFLYVSLKPSSSGAKSSDLQLVNPYQHFHNSLGGAKSFNLQLMNPYQHFQHSLDGARRFDLQLVNPHQLPAMILPVFPEE
ncbi:hypothetical protein V6N11_051340 [Hibiscus sabdariffa]|uniref:Uncharacterized protein n=1 Tax=Hibiscus sabdariffa TaxID=183260 RepID=A0ABR2AAQ9_9ROSI